MILRQHVNTIYCLILFRIKERMHNKNMWIKRLHDWIICTSLSHERLRTLNHETSRGRKKDLRKNINQRNKFIINQNKL